jgi:L-Ala-D/L-Glu epimerase
MNCIIESLLLETTHPFVIARGGARRHHNLILRLERDGLVGEGEGSPTHYYGETPAIGRAALEFLTERLSDELAATGPGELCPERIGEIMNAAARCLAGNGAAKAALDGALWDLLGKQRGVPVWRLLGLGEADTRPAAITSSFTVALAEPEQMLARVRAAVAAGFEIIKVKAGSMEEVGLVERMAAETGARFRVDANGSWRAREALAAIDRLAMAGVEFVEQPLEIDDLAGYRSLVGRSTLPIILDESVHDLLGLEVFGELADGVNLKVSKLGGIGRCLELARAAKEAGLELMMGCMIESSLGIAQALQLAPLLRWADLDGALLLAEDPYGGLDVDGANFRPGEAPGLGVERRSGCD